MLKRNEEKKNTKHYSAWNLLDRQNLRNFYRMWEISLDEKGELDPKQWKGSFKKMASWMFPEQDIAKMPETIAEAMFLRNSARLMKALCFNKHPKQVPVFKVLGPESDIFECGNSKRVLYIVSCLHNFASFREPYIEQFESLDDESTQLLEERMELEKETHRLEARLEQLRREREAEAPKIAALTVENTELSRRIRTLNEAQVQVKGRVEELKLQIEITANQCDAHREEIERVEVDIHDLGDRIVDPEKIRDHLKTQKYNIEREKKEIEHRSTAIKRITQRIEALERLIIDVGKVKQQLHLIRTTIDKEKSQKSKAAESRGILDELKGQLEDQEGARVTAEKIYQQCQDALDKLRKTRAEKIQQLHEELQVKTKCQKDAQTQAENTLRQIEQNDRMRQEVEYKMQSMKKDHHASFQVLQRNFDDLVSQVRRYHTSLASLMQE